MERYPSMKKILVIDDNPEINQMVQVLLQRNQYDAACAFSGTEALLRLEKDPFDLILLDLMLPGLSGNEVLSRINDKYHIPVICVSAKDDIDTKLGMIRDGADDYITKPFNNEELIVRIGAVLRRTGNTKPQESSKIYRFKDLALDTENHLVTVGSKPVELTSKEYDILELLMSSPKKVFSKQNIFESVWSEEYIVDERAVTVHVSNLRSKLKNGDCYIKTVWGIGYKMQDN
jgi:DNA-binding response OmpR family regulator